MDWLGLAVAVAAAYFAWRANRKSEDANRIARRALDVSESERRRQRDAFARLIVSAEVANHEPDEQGVIRLGGSQATLRLAITVANRGDRDAGRGRIKVTLPRSVTDRLTHWSDPTGLELPAFPQHAARVGEAHVIDRPLDGVSQGFPETYWLTVPVNVPSGSDVNDYPLYAQVTAAGAIGPAALDFLLRVGPE